MAIVVIQVNNKRHNDGERIDVMLNGKMGTTAEKTRQGAITFLQ